MVVAGLLVMDSRAGTLIYSQRFSPAYGLASCDQGACLSPGTPKHPRSPHLAACAPAARDEMRLSAMLFALHLNAAAIHSAAPAGGPVAPAPLSSWVMADMELHFCVHPARQLLLVLVTEATLGCAPGAFLASELLHRFVECFEAPLMAAGTPAATPRSSLRRQKFAPSLLSALLSLPTWMMSRMASREPDGSAPVSPHAVASTTAATDQPVVLLALVALHAPELCALLAQPPPLASSGARESQPQPLGAPNNSISYNSSRRPSKQQLRRPAAEGVRQATVAIGHTGARDTAWDAVVAPLASAAMPPEPSRSEPSSPPSSPARRGCLRGCVPARHGARGTARRPAPNLPTAERAAAQSPLVFGWPPERPGTDSRRLPAPGRRPGHSASGATEAATLHRLLCAAQHAWRGHCTHERLSSALVLKPAVGTAVDSGSSSGGSEAVVWQGEVLLTCAPLLLFASVSVELPTPKHTSSRLKVHEEEGRERAVAGCVAAAVHELSHPLSLVLAFLHRVRPSLEVLASSTTASTGNGIGKP